MRKSLQTWLNTCGWELQGLFLCYPGWDKTAPTLGPEALEEGLQSRNPLRVLGTMVPIATWDQLHPTGLKVSPGEALKVLACEDG